jgi:hypothetical protein
MIFVVTVTAAVSPPFPSSFSNLNAKSIPHHLIDHFPDDLTLKNQQFATTIPA